MSVFFFNDVSCQARLKGNYFSVENLLRKLIFPKVSLNLFIVYIFANNEIMVVVVRI